MSFTEDLAVNELGHMEGYLAAGATIVVIRPWQDGLITTAYPSSVDDQDTQLPLIAGMVSSVMRDSRLAKVREQAVPLLLKHPELLPALLQPLEAYDRDIEQLDTQHPAYASEVKRAVSLISEVSATEDWKLSVEIVMRSGQLMVRREGSTEARH